MKPKPSQLYRLAEERIHGTLEDFVAARRRCDGPPWRSPMSWRSIARELADETGVEINHETLRLWFGRRPDLAPAARRREGAA